MVCELTVPGDPQSKGRPRVYQGHGITPTRPQLLERLWDIDEKYVDEHTDPAAI